MEREQLATREAKALRGRTALLWHYAMLLLALGAVGQLTSGQGDDTGPTITISEPADGAVCPTGGPAGLCGTAQADLEGNPLREVRCSVGGGVIERQVAV
jgi:hypothetical protein